MISGDTLTRRLQPYTHSVVTVHEERGIDGSNSTCGSLVSVVMIAIFGEGLFPDLDINRYVRSVQ